MQEPPEKVRYILTDTLDVFNVLKLIVINLDKSEAPLLKSPDSIEEPEDSILSSSSSSSSSFPAKVTRSGSSLSADSIDEICNEEIKVWSVYKG